VTPIEIGDLEDLLAHKGWAWLMARYEAEFGPAAMLEHITKIANHTTDLSMKTAKIDQALSSRLSVAGFLELPQREIQKQRDLLARRSDSLETMRRRGTGL
jgi:hypothetical protein